MHLSLYFSYFYAFFLQKEWLQERKVNWKLFLKRNSSSCWREGLRYFHLGNLWSYISWYNVFFVCFSPLISLHIFSCFELFRQVKKNGIKDLKRLKAVLDALVKQQAKLLAKLNLAELYSPREVKPTKDKLRKMNRRLSRFNARTKIYLETKLADPAWDAANIGKWWPFSFLYGIFLSRVRYVWIKPSVLIF